jgi:hypothetical protein
MGWRYGGDDKVIVFAIIGDPVPATMCSDTECEWKAQQNYRCGTSVQGIFVYSNRIELSKKRERVGVFCVETGLDEKDFWLLANDPPH